MTPARRQADLVVVDACRRVLAVHQERIRSLAVRDDAVSCWQTRAGGAKRTSGERLRALLLSNGFTNDDISLIGLSDGNLRLIYERTQSR